MQKNKKKATNKKRVSNAVKNSKVSFKKKSKKYIYPSIIFGLMLTAFNFVFLILALYSDCYSGLYMQLTDTVALNVIANIIFEFLLFSVTFFVVSYLFIEVVIGKHY